MTIGVSRYEFYHSTLVELKDYDKVYENRRKIEDEKALFNGIYTFEAVSIALSNAFRAKGTEPKKYRTKTILQEYEEQHRPLTEEEKQKQIDNLFAMLGGMQERFEKQKRGGD